MFIQQAYSKNFDFVKYLPIPIVFFLLMLLNYVAIVVMNVDVDSLIQDQIKEKGENRVFFETVLPLSVGLVLLLLWVKFIHKQSIRSLTTARNQVDWGRVFFAFGLWATVTVALTLTDYFMQPENYELNFRPVSFAILAVLAIVLIPMQTSFEEYLFRGYLMQGLGVATRSTLFALIFTSVMFGLMHIANPEVGEIGYVLLLYYIGTGFFLGIITLMDDGLELALGYHAANNLITVLLVTSDWGALQTPSIFKDNTEPEAGLYIYVPLLILFPLILFIFSKKYKWSGWKERLTGRIKTHAINTTTLPHHE